MAIEDTDINEAALAPKKVRTEEGSVEEKPVTDLIAADRYARAKTSGDAVPWGIRMARLKPGSTTPGNS